jgi:hypothetical protein
MAGIKIKLRGMVLTWTILTTTFFWTSTMRIIMKPEISAWSIFKLGGAGLEGAFWFPPFIVVMAMLLFYLEGRGRFRMVYHILLLAWHLALTAAIIYGSSLSDGNISFGTWGIQLAFFWLIVPVVVFLALSVILVWQEHRGKTSIPVFGWTTLNWRSLGLVLLMIPVALVLFRLGTGFNWIVKIAVATTIVQWIILAEALGRPYPPKEDR